MERRIDIVIALDISESMRIEDFTPNRLEAAKNVATDFYTVYLSWAIVFYLLWMFSKSTFISNVLVD